MNFRFSLLFLLAGMLPLLATSCVRSQPADAGADQSRFPWSVHIGKWEVSSELTGSVGDVQYDGAVQTRKVERKPSPGMVWLIVGLTLDKQTDGSAPFSWNDVRIEGADGTRYPRIPDDSFLELFGIRRIKAVDLTFGEHEGSVCFEIPRQASARSLTFVHETPAGRNAIRLR